ncbi:MAG TPA: tRNA lysidine(34) synthetase TilS [Ideonella sp.]|uniref:tRNA lysidine(34) synthetase TilS n=1 Tax=Ideonella sp. TaxID=1929293 RepID=UPI002BC86CB5|nr:tRNA lysidine(34) synthetase TilS [Ideonella sp.]HSI51201.1 tRNA lysidine(34) synthetase TilS [Ideonella sp.]
MAVATSGGRDSTALLHATLRQTFGSGLQVLALHVHHGLMPQADAWLAHLEAQCQRWRSRHSHLCFESTRLSGAPSPGQSIEAWARRERYAALARMAKAHGAGIVLLAHHRRDQAETVLLQALRGAGPAGLSAMPGLIEREGIIWARPWLQQPVQAIETYVRRHRLRHIEDDSNHDARFDRNRLRHQVLPALSQAFPQAEQQLVRMAEQAQAAAALMAEVATQDLAAMGLSKGGGLPLSAWLALSPARRRFSLQAWLQQHQADAPDSLVARLLAQLPGAKQGSWPLAPGEELRLHRGVLQPHALARSNPANAASVQLPQAAGPGEWPALAWQGRFALRATSEAGIPLALLAGACLAARSGGEQFQRAPRSTPRSLKKQFQAAAMPAWARQAPLLRASNGQLLFVPGLGIDARAMAAPGEPQLKPEWLPHPTAPA